LKYATISDKVEGTAENARFHKKEKGGKKGGDAEAKKTLVTLRGCGQWVLR